MPRVTLKNILSKKNHTEALVLSLINEMNAQLTITDEKNTHLCGNVGASAQYEHPVKLQDEIIGWVKGDEKSVHVASLLTLLVQKEFERKNLGNEVLTLYQEVNMVFNFSDKLAQAIEPVSIAQIAVDEAMHLINSVSAVVVLWDEASKQLQIPATAGEQLFSKENLARHADVLLKIGLSGQSEIMSDLTALRDAKIIDSKVQSIVYAALKVKHRIMGAIILAGDEPMQYAASDLKFLTTLALQSSSAIESALLYEKNIRAAKESEEAMRRVYEVAGKFVPYEFLGSLGHDVITTVKLGDQVEKIVTVLFSDIRDYTTLSEQMTPEENFSFVCSFNEQMGPIIRRNNGFINQYLGDAIMAIFPYSAIESLQAAIEMQIAVQEFNRKQIAIGSPVIEIGVGLHTGSLIMGITGDEHRMDATTISDTVNTTSRLESLTKHYKGNIIISEDTYKQLSNISEFDFRYLGLVQVKGKKSLVSIYECFSANTIEQKLLKRRTLPFFDEGIFHYTNKSFEDAIIAFQQVIKENPEDLTTKFFLTNAKSFRHSFVLTNLP